VDCYGKRNTVDGKEDRSEAHTLPSVRPHRFPCAAWRVRSVRLRQDEDDEKIRLAEKELPAGKEAAESQAESRKVQERQKKEKIGWISFYIILQK
jgi:hypothetical protein